MPTERIKGGSTEVGGKPGKCVGSWELQEELLGAGEPDCADATEGVQDSSSHRSSNRDTRDLDKMGVG